MASEKARNACSGRFGQHFVGILQDILKLVDRGKIITNQKTLSQIYIHVLNHILHDVLKKEVATALWLKLEQLSMIKSLIGKLYLKQNLYSHRMIECTSLENQLDVFKEIIIDLETLEIKYVEEDFGFDFIVFVACYIYVI